LLNAAEQKLFRRLAVFACGCTLESAEAVCNTRRDLELDLLDAVSSLLDKNLLQRVQQSSGEPRFEMLWTIREYALERLSVNGEVESTRRAHAAYCIVLAEEGAALSTGRDRDNWLALCNAEHDNLRAALDWLVETGDGEWALRLSTALYVFWERGGHLAEGRERLEAVLNLPPAASSTKKRARAMLYAGNFANRQGDFATAVRIHQEGLSICSQLGDRKGIAAHIMGVAGNIRWGGDLVEARTWHERYLEVCRELGERASIAAALCNLGDLVIEQGDHALARSLFEEALSIFRELGDRTGVGWSFSHLGDVACHEGNFAEARRLYLEGADAFRTVGDRWGIGRSFVDLGRLASEENDHEAAHSLFEQAADIFLDLEHKTGLAQVLQGLACVAVREGDFDLALMLDGAAEGLRQRLGAPARPAERASFEHILEPAWRGVEPDAAEAIWTAAWRMPLDEAIRGALRPASRAPSTGS
jgi:tetratricopeptide (TPR) repeat protein